MLDEASFLTFCSFCDEMSNIIGNKQSPEQILPTIKIGSLKGLDAEKIYQRGLRKRNNNLTELQCICNCTIMKAMRSTAKQYDKSCGLRYSLIFARITHEIKGTESEKCPEMATEDSGQSNPIQSSTLFSCSNRYASHVGLRNTEVYG